MAGAGVGEAALLGAAMGGGSAMLTGGDPLKGALMGTLTGGAGAGISGLLPGATAVAPGVIPAVAPNAANVLNSAYQVAAPAATTAFTQIPVGQTFAQASQAAMNPAVNSLGSGAFGILPEATGGISNLLTNAAAVPPIAPAVPPTEGTFMEGMGKFAKDPIASIMANKPTAIASALAGTTAKKKKEEEEEYTGPLSRFKYNPDAYRPAGYADGGVTNLSGYDQMVGEEPMYMSDMARGGIADLGGYSDGGRMLKGPGDGMSDNIPATIAGKRPARLADGEFVIPADVVSHLGNGSSDAGAKQLYAMMDKVRKARTGRKAQGRKINPRQYMAA